MNFSDVTFDLTSFVNKISCVAITREGWEVRACSDSAAGGFVCEKNVDGKELYNFIYFIDQTWKKYFKNYKRLEYFMFTEDMRCPGDSVQYSGSCFHVMNEPTTWSRAYNSCESLGAELIVITSSGKQEFVKQLVESSGLTNVWTGQDRQFEILRRTIMIYVFRFTCGSITKAIKNRRISVGRC